LATNEMDFASIAGGPFMNGHSEVSLIRLRLDSLRQLLGPLGPDFPVVFQGRFNEDNDGAPNCYGPRALGPLESLANAASPYQNFGINNKFEWVGLISRTRADARAENVIIDTTDPLLEARGPKGLSEGKWPVVQQRAGAKGADGKQLLPIGPRPGFYISSTSTSAQPGLLETNQNRYFNADAIPYGAISLGTTIATGVDMGDFGLVIRKKTGASAAFLFADSAGNDHTFKIGECSRALFKAVSNRDNSDDVCFILFPGSRVEERPTMATVRLIDSTVRTLMAELGKVSNPEALPRFLAMGANMNAWQSDGDHQSPIRTVEYDNICTALASWGYRTIGDFPSGKDQNRIAHMA
jgi:hypothetical protein